MLPKLMIYNIQDYFITSYIKKDICKIAITQYTYIYIYI